MSVLSPYPCGSQSGPVHPVDSCRLMTGLVLVYHSFCGGIPGSNSSRHGIVSWHGRSHLSCTCESQFLKIPELIHKDSRMMMDLTVATSCALFILSAMHPTFADAQTIEVMMGDSESGGPLPKGILDGKIQEQLGKVIGNEQSEFAGKPKQAEAGGGTILIRWPCDPQIFASRIVSAVLVLSWLSTRPVNARTLAENNPWPVAFQAASVDHNLSLSLR